MLKVNGSGQVLPESRASRPAILFSQQYYYVVRPRESPEFRLMQDPAIVQTYLLR
jgi:hypothetical protein